MKYKNEPMTRDGKRYSSVRKMLVADGVSKRFLDRYDQLRRKTLIIDRLISLRLGAGLTQGELAKKMGITQGAVSKLEASCDENLTLKEIGSYAQAVGEEHVGVMLGKEEFEPELAHA